MAAQGMEMGGYGSVSGNRYRKAGFSTDGGSTGNGKGFSYGNKYNSPTIVNNNPTHTSNNPVNGRYNPDYSKLSGAGDAGSGAGGGGSTAAAAGDSGGGGSAGPSLADMLAAYREQQMAAAKAAMDAANGQIDASLNTALQGYNRQRDNAKADYQTALNTSELNRFWAGKNLRETQANRGLLDSGAGRQDRLFMDSNYNNNVTKILNERTRAYQDIENAINNARQQAANAKAANYANYMSANAGGMTTLLSNLLTGYTGQVSDLTNLLANFNAVPDDAVQNAAYQTPTYANILAAYNDDNDQTYKKKNTNYVY